MSLILVHEQISMFTAELKRHFVDQPDVQVRWVPHFVDLQEHLQKATLVVIHLKLSGIAQVEASVDVLLRSSSRQLLLLREENAEVEWVLREAGADAILPDTVKKVELLNVVEKLLDL